jgi:hypothetical protein
LLPRHKHTYTHKQTNKKKNVDIEYKCKEVPPVALIKKQSLAFLSRRQTLFDFQENLQRMIEGFAKCGILMALIAAAFIRSLFWKGCNDNDDNG